VNEQFLLADFVEETYDALMCPVFPQSGQDVSHTSMEASQDSSPGDGAINIGDDDFVIPVPQVDGSFTATRALVLSGDAEHHVVGAIF
ncbi:uncharacterized, partial [Tachysurus ichikawai]